MNRSVIILLILEREEILFRTLEKHLIAERLSDGFDGDVDGFIFPGSDEYHNSKFNPSNLTMLGVKSSCKDRWRQVLSEADRIENKHLLTLEAAISTNQTSEMKTKKLQLVLPKNLHHTYTDEQQEWLMNLSEFVELVLDRQP